MLSWKKQINESRLRIYGSMIFINWRSGFKSNSNIIIGLNQENLKKIRIHQNQYARHHSGDFNMVSLEKVYFR